MKPSERAEVRRHLAATPERVFAAFASAEVVGQWLTPDPEVKLSVLELDFREGGRYRFVYDTPGGQRMEVGGVYREIEAPCRLVFSWLIEPPDIHAGIESRVTISIAPNAEGSDLVILHERFERADANARHAEGWRGAVDQLQRLLASRRQSS
ncbi:MAG TPA: SRPBCC domain-containing protein [Polyangiaceae bacterium]|nr:SRPBCC domain-containing protein [Polyangiaceae bacterium]